MPRPEAMVWVTYALGVALVALIAYAVWDVTRLLRAHRRMAKLLAEREEYRPMLDTLAARARRNGGILKLTEREALDVREQVREGLVFLEPGDRRRIEHNLRGHTVQGREAYLRNLLCTSMNRIDQPRQHA